ncbi:MAG: NAD(P)-dependent oxidoreductase, partial [Ignavibacteria bacterium]|nr:NAD(P)-dependent oxidoreductase [Ignavibacteria bacterium]
IHAIAYCKLPIANCLLLLRTMKKIVLAIIREGKMPPDTRVAFNPEQCLWLKNKFPEIDIIVQSSPIRCYKDDEYIKENIEVVEDVSHADWMIGIKEVPIKMLVPNKKYMFFSHTIKKQPHNKKLLQEINKRNITLVDYECLTWENGERILGFGHYAGVVGAYNGFLTWGKRYKSFELKPAWLCKNYDEMLEQFKSIKLPPMKIAVTGTGRVARGVFELLEKLNLRMVSVQNFLTQTYDEPVYVVLNTSQLYERKDGKPFKRNDFHKRSEQYHSAFLPFTKVTDMFMNAIFWDPKTPAFFTKEDMRAREFRIKVIADITCDVDGSVPATIRDTSIQDPVFGYNPLTEQEDKPFQPQVIDVMAVSNLPNELPREASTEFGDKLTEFVVEEMLETKSNVIERATIAEEGSLMPHYKYLQDYIMD